MEQNQNRFAPEALADESASSPNSIDEGPASGIAFDPVPLRYRDDGLTPQKQREYVEALADTGLVNVAASRIGVSPQAVNRVRRRADARSFDLACTAAQRFGARHLQTIAFERAIQGTIRRHHYHGEVVSEEVVFDNRLLIYLLGKTEHLLDEQDREARAVCAQWEPYMEALEQGLPPPSLEPVSPYADQPCAGDEVWEEKDESGEEFLATNVPPSPDFDGDEDGEPGEYFYRRTLTEAEEAAWYAWDEEDRDFAVALPSPWNLCRKWRLTHGNFFPMEAEPSETSAGARRAAKQRAGGQRPRERPADGSAEPNPIDVTAQWCRDEAEDDDPEAP